MNNKCPFILHCNDRKKDMTCHFPLYPSTPMRNIILNMLRIRRDRYFTHP